MKNTKSKLGTVKVCLERGSVNALLGMLDTMMIAGDDTAFGDAARALRDKIIKYGKPIRLGDMDEVQIFFYENEAEKLIVLVSLYLSLTQNSHPDRYPEIGLRYEKGLGMPKEAEQNAQ